MSKRESVARAWLTGFLLATLASSGIVGLTLAWSPTWRDDFGLLNPALVLRETVVGFRFTLASSLWIVLALALGRRRGQKVTAPLVAFGSLPVLVWGLEATANQWSQFFWSVHNPQLNILWAWQGMATSGLALAGCAVAVVTIRRLETPSESSPFSSRSSSWSARLVVAAVFGNWLGYLYVLDRLWIDRVGAILRQANV